MDVFRLSVKVPVPPDVVGTSWYLCKDRGREQPCPGHCSWISAAAEALLKTSSERLPGREGAGYIPRCSVILCPDPDKLIQMVRPQDGGVAGQVFEVVHDDGHKQVEHLGEGEKGGEKGK